MPDIITRCPDCNIAFRAEPTQLTAARGLVRCGACLTVFNANENLQQPGPDTGNIDYMPYVLDSFGDLPTIANNEIGDEVSIGLEQQIGVEIESISLDDEQPKLGGITELDELLLGSEGPPTGKSKIASFSSAIAILGVAALLLATQAVYFNSASLSLNPEYRRAVQKFCAYTACPISEYRDLGGISLSQFIVQDHPQYFGALSIDLLLNNQAGYEQRFPGLIIRFNDLDDSPVAQRLFTPVEYLQGRFANGTIMPRNREIHVHLELVNPGNNAISYTLELTD